MDNIILDISLKTRMNRTKNENLTFRKYFFKEYGNPLFCPGATRLESLIDYVRVAPRAGEIIELAACAAEAADNKNWQEAGKILKLFENDRVMKIVESDPKVSQRVYVALNWVYYTPEVEDNIWEMSRKILNQFGARSMA